MPDAPKDAFLNDYAERNTTNVILSHMPLLFMPGSFVQNVYIIHIKKKNNLYPFSNYLDHIAICYR